MAGNKKAAPEQEQKKPGKFTGKVTGGNLNIRKKPDTESAKVGLLENGEEVTVLEDLGEWYRIKAGYVMSKWVQ